MMVFIEYLKKIKFQHYMNKMNKLTCLLQIFNVLKV